jgi:hypothetical protein
MRRLLVLAGTVVAAGLAAYGASAAGLGPFTSAPVAGGNAAIVACDSDGFSVTYTTSGGDVTSVTVGGIADPDCEGGELSLTLTDAGNGSIASGGPESVGADGDTSPNSIVVPVAAQPAAEGVAAYHIVVTGP